MDLDLHGRHALVCGASEGIGRATAQELALLGASVTVLARREPNLREVMTGLPRKEGQRHGYLVADSGQTFELAQAAGELAQRQPVQILVNNSGGPPGGPAHSAEIGAYVDAFNKHLVANQTLLQAVLPGMRDAGWGRVVNVISTSVYEPIPGLGVSNTIRGAVASWAKTLSRELGGDGITVNNVLPGYTETARVEQIVRNRMHKDGSDEDSVRAAMRAGVPTARFASAAEVSGVIAFLCSPAAGYINGVSLAVDGGRMQSI